MEENLNILYNIVGYYFQFVPFILEHIEFGKKEVEKELKECLKLYNWERSTVESFRRTRQKIWKYVKKYNEVLQQPIMIILNQDRLQRSETPPPWLEKKISDENNMDAVQFPLDIEQLNIAKRFLWFEEWKVKAKSTFKSPVLRESIPENCMTAWKESWNSFEKISARAAEFAHLWQHEKNNHKKKRVFRVYWKLWSNVDCLKVKPCSMSWKTREVVPAVCFFSIHIVWQTCYNPTTVYCHERLQIKFTSRTWVWFNNYEKFDSILTKL